MLTLYGGIPIVRSAQERRIKRVIIADREAVCVSLLSPCRRSWPDFCWAA